MNNKGLIFSEKERRTVDPLVGPNEALRIFSDRIHPAHRSESDEALHLMANRDFVDVRKDPNVGLPLFKNKKKSVFNLCVVGKIVESTYVVVLFHVAINYPDRFSYFVHQKSGGVKVDALWPHHLLRSSGGGTIPGVYYCFCFVFEG